MRQARTSASPGGDLTSTSRDPPHLIEDEVARGRLHGEWPLGRGALAQCTGEQLEGTLVLFPRPYVPGASQGLADRGLLEEGRHHHHATLGGHVPVEDLVLFLPGLEGLDFHVGERHEALLRNRTFRN